MSKYPFQAPDNEQLTQEQAIAFTEWHDWTHEQRFIFQMRQQLLCMPFEVLHEAVTETLNRPVYTHEFAFPQLLWDEYRGIRPAATLEDIINLIPEHKRIIILSSETNDEAH